MNISYRTRQALRRIFSVVAVVLAVTVVVLLCLFTWLHRFVVYTDDGVILDFSRRDDVAGKPPQDDTLPSITLRYDDTPFREGLQPISGYYVDVQELLKDTALVRSRLEQLPAGTPVLLDVKNYRGYFFYSTAVGAHTSGLVSDIGKVDELLAWLGQSDLYVIARMPALRDFVTAWDNNSYGLKKTSGSLYTDSGDYGIGCWLDPSNAAVQNYLIDVLNELKRLGFDEVVLEDFCFPQTDDLLFSADRDEALAQCAQRLIDACADDAFTVSFASDDPAFVLPEGRCRLYLQHISAEDAQAAWEQAAVADKRLYLVFIAESDDTRYEIENGILRPFA